MTASSADSLADQLSRMQDEPAAAAEADGSTRDDDLAPLAGGVADDADDDGVAAALIEDDETDVNDESPESFVAEEPSDDESELEHDPADEPIAGFEGLTESAGEAGESEAAGEAEAAFDPAAFAEPARMPTPGARPMGRSRAKQGGGGKAVMAPILVTLGLLLLVPGVWAIGTLLGMEWWLFDQPKVKVMAAAMLISWPIALILMGAGVVYMRQAMKAKKKAEREQQGQ